METQTLCMFCGKDETHGAMDREHFVPQCMWSGPRPDRTRPVPAHRKCNNSFSADNEYFREILVFEEGAKGHPEVDRFHREQIKQKMERRFGSIVNALKDLRLRPLKTRGGIYLGHAPSFKVDWPRIERVLRNVMKGIYYTVNEQPLPQDWELQVKTLEGQDLTPIKDFIGRMVPWQDFGDDVFRCRYVFDPKGAMYCFMQFYRNRVFTGLGMSQEFFEGWHEHALSSMLIDRST